MGGSHLEATYEQWKRMACVRTVSWFTRRFSLRATTCVREPKTCEKTHGNPVGEAYDTVPLEPNGVRRAQHLHDLVFGHARRQIACACRTRSRDATDSQAARNYWPHVRSPNLEPGRANWAA